MEILYLLSLLFCHYAPTAFAVNASPHRFNEKQPDGSITELRVVGDTENHHMIDKEGYTVIEDDKDWFVYAKEDEATGKIKPTHFKVDKEDPKKHGLKKGVKGKENRGKGKERNIRQNKTNRKLITSGKLRNLVILMKFSDHVSRNLPTAYDINVLFNKLGGDEYLAPTGSIRDLYQQNSYGKLDLVSTVHPWITLPQTEAYYSNSNYGDSAHILSQSLEYALNEIDNDPNFSFKNFDIDDDGFIDAVTFLHSGYGAEWGATDCYGQHSYNRIWSHMSYMSWESKIGVKVEHYHISPVLWDTCGSKIGRIGVIAHELGHFLGLPDLYDTDGGNGIGSFDLMSNCWGFDGSQLYPPLMSAWSKIKLGWVVPQIISKSGLFQVSAAKDKSSAYKIEHNYPSGEYLLIENRQPLGFDAKIPQGGLAIWHIDENAAITIEGYPGQIGGWPENRNHYRVALLQADGLYELEHGLDYGDADDLWYAGGKSNLGPSSSNEGPYPNTDTYQNGDIRKTGVEILEIGSAGSKMSFKVSLDGIPVDEPSDLLELVTTYQGEVSEYGCMFDILPRQNLIIKSFSVHLRSTEQVIVEIWTKRYSYEGYEKNPKAWKKVGEFSVEGNRHKGPTPLPLKSLSAVPVQKYRKQAFYVTVKGRKNMLATMTSGNPRQIYKQNNDLRIFAGVAVGYSFSTISNPIIWNGGVRYSLSNEIETTFSGGSGQAGVMFDIVANKNIAIMSMELNLQTTEAVIVEVWTRGGSHAGKESRRLEWKRIGRRPVKGKGKGNRTALSSKHFPPVKVSQGNTQAFYVTLTDSITMRYTYGDRTGAVYVENGDMKVLVGTGKKYPFGNSYSARVWNGILHYVVA